MPARRSTCAPSLPRLQSVAQEQCPKIPFWLGCQRGKFETKKTMSAKLCRKLEDIDNCFEYEKL